jgi:co-chaperonin GroES (HSP10)
MSSRLLRTLHLVGDRVLIDPDGGEKQTRSGLYLPASVAEKQRVGSGRVVRVGPGYLTANPEFSETEAWNDVPRVRYLPLQAQPGDDAFYLRKEAIEIALGERRYYIVHHSAILALQRPERDLDEADLDDLDLSGLGLSS